MQERGAPVTSEMLAEPMGMNPVVFRRTMGGLRDAGIVRSAKGHGGGWELARALEDVTLGEVYEALGTPELFGLGPRIESPGCLVEQAVNRAIVGALDEAKALWLARLREIIAAWPETREKLSHGAPTWWGGRKTFASFADNHHGDGRVAVWVK